MDKARIQLDNFSAVSELPQPCCVYPLVLHGLRPCSRIVTDTTVCILSPVLPPFFLSDIDSFPAVLYCTSYSTVSQFFFLDTDGEEEQDRGGGEQTGGLSTGITTLMKAMKHEEFEAGVLLMEQVRRWSKRKIKSQFNAEVGTFLTCLDGDSRTGKYIRAMLWHRKDEEALTAPSSRTSWCRPC